MTNATTPKGGSHVTGFERAITKAFNEAMRGANILKKNEADVIKDDIMEGLTAVITVRMSEPQFEGQTKEVLGTAAATKIVSTVVSEKLRTTHTSQHHSAQHNATQQHSARLRTTQQSEHQ